MLWSSHENDHRRCLFEWKSDEIKIQGSRSLLKLPWVVNLIDELSRSDSVHCRGLLSVLFAGHQIAAMHFGIVNESTLVSWISCVNPKFARYLPSGILFLEIAKAAAKQKVRLIDLGCEQNRTKVRLANDVSSVATGAVCESRFNFQRLQLTSHAKHVVRSAINRLTTKQSR